MQVCGLRAPVNRAPGRNVELSVCTNIAVLGVLVRMTGIELGCGAAMEVQGISWKARQQIETRLQNGNKVGDRRPRGREDVAVVHFVEFGTREPEEVAQMQTERIELGTWPLCHCLACVGRLPGRCRCLRAAGR